tara:strand:- start:3862 stop:4848 length:987 start_codon:yes stop_codon:yes gene_type:complete
MPIRSTRKSETYFDFFATSGNEADRKDYDPPVLIHFGARGVIFGGGSSDVIQYITIANTGNATDFGDLNSNANWSAATSSGSQGRAVKAGGASDHTTIDYVTIASTGNATDFGDLFKPMREFAGCSNVTRGVFGGGYAESGGGHDTMQYITIATTGNSTDFGNASSVWTANGCGNGTRGTWMGGYNGGASPNTQIDYVTLATTSNTSDFGDLSYSCYGPGGACANSPSENDRGIYMGGQSPTYSNPETNSMSYITISTTGNGQDFGDLASTAYISGAQNNATRGVQCGSGSSNVMQYFTIGTLGNAQDFGDLLSGASGFTAMGNSSGD